MAMPLTFAVLLHLVDAPRESGADRGSVEPIGSRGLAVLLALMLVAGSVLVGLAAGPWHSLSFALGIAVVGLPCVAIPGRRRDRRSGCRA